MRRRNPGGPASGAVTPQRKPLADRLAMPGLTPSPEALGAGGITATPHTGSLPAIKHGEDVFAPTTTGSHRAIRNPLTSKRRAATRPAPTAKRRKRDGWVPDQHGAWAMVVVPFWLGAAWSEVRPLTFVLFALWFVGYFCFYAASLWFRSARRERYWPPVRAYGLATLALGVLTVVLAPPIIEWSVLFLPLVVILAWQSWHKRDRSLLARTSTILASGLMCLVTYDVGTHFNRSGLGATWLQHSPADAAAIQATPDMSVLTGWAWIAFLASAVTAYFWSTVPYVKTLVREFRSRGYLVFSVAAHLVFTGLFVLAAAFGWCSFAPPLVWVVLSVRALVWPLVCRRRGKRPSVRAVGWSEVGLTLAMLIALHI